MNLALFDLDHTLIPFDSGMAWTRFLIERGDLPPQAEHDYLGHCHAYVAGTLDIRAMHRATVQPLRAWSAEQLEQRAREFEAHVAPRLPDAARRLVRRHRQAGDRCAIVTATTRFIAEPFARLFGADAVLATEPARGPDGKLTGEIDGEPCWREHKVVHVRHWLARQQPPQALEDFAQSWFYSDSASDLPLLRAVTHPAVVRPGSALREQALSGGWPVLELD